MNRPLGRLGAAATLGQHCPQMTQIRCITDAINYHFYIRIDYKLFFVTVLNLIDDKLIFVTVLSFIQIFTGFKVPQR